MELGCVIKVLLIRDGLVKGAVHHVAGQGQQARLMEHLVSLLYPLETCMEENCQETTGIVTDTLLTDTTIQSSQDFPKRPRRAAVCEACDHILAQTLCDY